MTTLIYRADEFGEFCINSVLRLYCSMFYVVKASGTKEIPVNIRLKGLFLCGTVLSFLHPLSVHVLKLYFISAENQPLWRKERFPGWHLMKKAIALAAAAAALMRLKGSVNLGIQDF